MPVLTTAVGTMPILLFYWIFFFFFSFFLIHREIKFITRKNQLFLFHVFHLHSLCLGNREVEKRRTRQTRSSRLSRVCRPLRAQPWHSEVWSPFLLPQTWTLMPELLMQGTMTLISIFWSVKSERQRIQYQCSIDSTIQLQRQEG